MQQLPRVLIKSKLVGCIPDLLNSGERQGAAFYRARAILMERQMWWKLHYWKRSILPLQGWYTIGTKDQ